MLILNLISFVSILIDRWHTFDLIIGKKIIYIIIFILQVTIHMYKKRKFSASTTLCLLYFYASAYINRQLTTNFELWVEILYVPTCFHMRIPKPCLSVCPYPEKRNHPGFVHISPTLVIDTSMERSSHEYYSMETQKFDFFLSSK